MNKELNNVKLKMSEGLNWGQVVLDFLAEDIGISKDLAFRLGSLLGSGLNKGSVCGAITSAYIALGLKYGNDMSLTKQKMKEFDKEFLELNQYFTCEELLGANVTIPGEREKIIASGIKGKVCPKAISTSIEILKKL